jgi:hypothetical protein
MRRVRERRLLRHAEHLKHRAKLQRDNVAPGTAQEARLVIAMKKQQIEELKKQQDRLQSELDMASRTLAEATNTTAANATATDKDKKPNQAGKPKF